MKKKSIPCIHFIGIGGIGMSALARYFLTQKAHISGSDAAKSEITEELKKEGVKVKIGHKTANITPKIGLIIHSAAIPENNPEVRKAKQLGLPIKSYSEAIGELTRKYKTIAVTGSHGKSTTTALLSLVLMNTRFDPTVIIGTKLKEFINQRKSAINQRKSAFGTNFRKGKSDYLILEADEYQKSFLRYSPIAAIITNIDREHLDVYKNLNNIKKVFLKFIKNIRSGGILVVNKDDKNLFGLKNKIQKITKKNNLKIFWYGVKNQYRGHPMSQILTKSNFRTSDVRKLKKTLKIPGAHNLSNALAVYTLARLLGIKQKKIFSAIAKYRGAWRRMEYKGELRIKNNELRNRKKTIIHNSEFIIPVYDDYAHHPTEIKATLAAFRQKYPYSTIICVFQPHQAQRLKALFADFAGAFDETDCLILLDIYKVAGRDIISISKYNSKKLAEAIQGRLKRKLKHKNVNMRLSSVIYLPNPKNLPKAIKNLLNSRSYILNPAIVVMMGAGDIYLHTKIIGALSAK